MAVKTRTKTRVKQRMVWLYGSKKRGVSLYRLNYKTPQWRVAFWKNGRLFRAEDYPTRKEALIEGNAYAREVKKGGFIY